MIRIKLWQKQMCDHHNVSPFSDCILKRYELKLSKPLQIMLHYRETEMRINGRVAVARKMLDYRNNPLLT
ncbi:hypothetical protein D3C78_1692230 [compost metagenome]